MSASNGVVVWRKLILVQVSARTNPPDFRLTNALVPVSGIYSDIYGVISASLRAFAHLKRALTCAVRGLILLILASTERVGAVSGNLDLTAGGSILNYKDREYVSDTEKRGGGDYDRNRRAVYIPVVRSSMYEVFQAFDLPDPSTSNGDRSATVVGPQALFMMNGSVVLAHTKTMAGKLLARADLDDAGRVREAYERALGRPPAAKEIDRALTFIAQVERAMKDRNQDPAERRAFAWQSFCKSLIASNEFIYLN